MLVLAGPCPQIHRQICASLHCTQTWTEWCLPCPGELHINSPAPECLSHLPLQDAYQFYQAQMVGNLPGWYDIPWRSNALTYDADTNLGFSNLTGGWCEGGEIGESLICAGFCTCQQLWALSRQQAPELVN